MQLIATGLPATSRRFVVASTLIGVVDGLFSGLTGTGGGAIVVPLLVLNLRIPQRVAHGTSLAIMVAAALIGAATYSFNDYISWKLAAQLVVGSLVGVVLGARLMMKVPVGALRRAFGLVMMLVALRLLIGG